MEPARDTVDPVLKYPDWSSVCEIIVFRDGKPYYSNKALRYRGRPVRSKYVLIAGRSVLLTSILFRHEFGHWPRYGKIKTREEGFANLSVYLPRELREKLTAYATQNAKSLNAVVRAAIRTYIRSQTNAESRTAPVKQDHEATLNR